MSGARTGRFFGKTAFGCSRLQSIAVDSNRCGESRGRNRLRDVRGSVLMESVLVLPLLLMLMTGIFQFARFWQARLLTKYAAFNAARAALVYNPLHYRIPADDPGPHAGEFRTAEGVCWLAAVDTLAWVSATSGWFNFRVPGYGTLPKSARIQNQVRIVPDGCAEENGWVKVTVAFDFPTIFCVFDTKRMRKGARLSYSEPMARLRDVEIYRTFTFEETCLLPKPWTTERYPHVGLVEQAVLSSQMGSGI